MLRPKKSSAKQGTNVNLLQDTKKSSDVINNPKKYVSDEKEPENLSLPSFVKLSKRGSVVPVFKENYLKDVVSCGISLCKLCSSCLLLNTPILIPDTNVFLHELDMLSHKSNTSIIILQTVLEELQNRNLNLYERVRSLLRKEPNRFFVFTNEILKDTFIERTSGESSNDRNDRAIRVAVSWYMSHLKSSVIVADIFKSVIFITNDAENRELAKAKGIDTAMSGKNQPNILLLLI